MKLSVSYLSVKKKDIPKVLGKLDATNVDYIHIDVMDGKYVKNKVNLFSSVKKIGEYTRKRFDIHFMVEKPLKMIDEYCFLDAYCMTFHVDIKDDLNKIIDKCHSYGIKVGIALNPDQDLSLLDPYIDKIDLVLIMSVVPGLPGQKFIKDVVPKIKKLRKKINSEKRKILISVDGGVNLDTKKMLMDVDILVSGSYVTNSEDYRDVVNKLKTEICKK